MQTRVILVGGFLGAGKTSLLFEVATKLVKQGKRIGLITNDQAPELVDTTLLEHAVEIIKEVSGACVCCNFAGFTEAIFDLIKNHQAEVIIAEPVGSCTDLSATVLQPLKDHFGKDFVVAPLTVLVDPQRLSDILDGRDSGLHPSAVYIIEKQIEEADIIAISKADLLTEEEIQNLQRRAEQEWPGSEVLVVSSKTGEGLDQWLSEVVSRTDAGKNIVEVDYDIYAEGEAVLGWLNTTLELKGDSIDWDKFAKDLLTRLSRRFDEADSAIGHVKLIVEVGSNFVIGNLISTDEPPTIRRSAGVGNEARMTLNARVQMAPQELEKIAFEEIANVCGSNIRSEAIALKCLSPGYPRPTYRYDRVVTPPSN